MAEKIKHPSLPSNYVSILQLQERWMKEQNRGKQQEGQEQRRREEPILKEKEEVRKSNEDGEKCKGSNSKFVPRRPYHPRNGKSSNRGKFVAIHRKLEEVVEAKVEIIAVTDTVVVVGEEDRGGERRSDGSKEKQKRKKNGKNRKLKKEVEVTGDMVVPALKVVENEIVPINRESEKKTMRSEWRCKGKNVVVKGEVSEPKSDTAVEIGQEVDDRVVKGEVSEPKSDTAVEIGQEVDNHVVNRRKLGGKERTWMRVERNGGGGGGGGGGRYRDPGRSRERESRKPRDGSLVWVKKGEVPD